MITKQRPVIGPMRSAAFAYIDDQFYWDLDGLHAMIVQYLMKYGFTEEQLAQGAWGRVSNWSSTEVPQYGVDWFSDQFVGNSDAQSEAFSKLNRLFPHIKQGKLYFGTHMGAIYDIPSFVDDDHADMPNRYPWFYFNGNLYVGAGGSSHMELYRSLKAQGVTVDLEDAWEGVYAGDSSIVAIFGCYDQVEFANESEIDPGLIRNLWQKWPGMELMYRDFDGDRAYITPKVAHWTIDPKSVILSAVDDAMKLIQEQVDTDPAAKAAYQALSNAGGTVYVVGGAVRDAVLGNKPKDIDLMCAGLNDEQITAALSPIGRLDFTGKQFGVYRFKTGGSEVEIALPRTEQSTGGGHKDFEITADPYLDPVEDLARRDFTGNAMAYNPFTGELLDPHNGADDLRNGNLKLVNDNAFRDDPLRIVRALVAQARFGLTPDETVIQAMKDNAQQIRHLPGERIQMEMDKLLAGRDPATAIQTAFDTGLIDYIAPELSSMQGFDQQNPHHDLHVDEHTLAVLRKIATLSNDPDVRLAALFHDSGKPDSFWRDETLPEGSGGHFYKKVHDDGTSVGENHEDVGAAYARAFMDRLRYPIARQDHVVRLVQDHMFAPFHTAQGARRFINKAGGDMKLVFDLLNLREADSSGKRTGEMSPKDAEIMWEMRKLVQDEVDKGSAFTVRDLAINGKDLIQMGYKPGPEIGRVLNAVLDRVIDNPELNDKDTLLGMIQAGV